MKTLPWRYVPWLLLDMARGPLWFPAAVLAAALLLPAVNAPAELVTKVFPYVLEAAGFLSVLALTRGLVNKDLRRGYYRVLFSRPVTPGGYYLLRWLLGGAALLAFAALFTGIISWKYGVALPFPFYAARLGLEYLVLGGLVFLLSTLLREDAGPALVLCALSAYYHGAAYPPAWLKAAGWLLPPLNLCRLTVAGTGPLPALLYGACAVAAAVYVLQRRNFAEGGRGD